MDIRVMNDLQRLLAAHSRCLLVTNLLGSERNRPSCGCRNLAYAEECYAELSRRGRVNVHRADDVCNDRSLSLNNTITELRVIRLEMLMPRQPNGYTSVALTVATVQRVFPSSISCESSVLTRPLSKVKILC